MFEDQQPQQPVNPLNPVMPAPGMTTPQAPSAPSEMSAPNVFTMPEKFRSTAPQGSNPKSGGGTKKLVIILIVVVVLAGLTVGALYVFQNVLNKNATNGNANVGVENTNTTNTSDLNTVVNSDLNASTNSTTNLNLAINGDLNTNAATNVNLDTNASSNTNITANTNSTTNTNSVVAAAPLPSSLDTDNDGLTDVEEQLYGTDLNKPDTDSDTFVDGKQTQADGKIIGELYLGYNPAGAGTLEASTLVKRVENGTKAYSLLIPAAWTATNDSNGGILITPTKQTGEYFQTQVNDNTTQQTPQNWYKAFNPNANVANLKSVAVNGLEGIVSEDGSTVYLFKGTKVYSLTYNTGNLPQVNYWTTFDMMQHSFKLVATS